MGDSLQILTLWMAVCRFQFYNGWWFAPEKYKSIEFHKAFYLSELKFRHNSDSSEISSNIHLKIIKI